MSPMRLVVCAGVALSIGASSVPAGDLNPPPGPVAPTMKTLDELAPGVSVQEVVDKTEAELIVSDEPAVVSV